jgi:membrane-associated protease RseP (regulator of RpoE activity)
MPSKKKKAKKEFKLSLWKPFLVGVLFLIWAIVEYSANADSLWFWLLIVLSVIIILPNVLWLKFKLGKPFGIPYFITMLKTKHFVNTIYKIAKHSWLMEKISIAGLFAGFGLAGIDYWSARKQGGWKRILILLIGIIGLGLVFHFSLTWLFSVPVLAPLFTLGLISFILLGFGGLSIAFLLGYGALSINAIIIGKQICPAVAPVLPGVPIPGLGVVIPLIAWISLGFILVIHESSHGILLARYKEKIKSVGLLLIGLVPMGAFVEQDDKTFTKRDDRKQLLVLSAGSSGNLATMFVGIALLLLFSFAIMPVMGVINTEYEKTYDGVIISEVYEDVSFCGITETAPAKDKLFANDKVISINGNDINSIGEINGIFRSAPDFNFIVLRNGVEENIFVEPYVFEDMNLRRIGVLFEGAKTGYEPNGGIQIIAMLINAISSVLGFFVILSFAVGMFNFLPSDPLDGGRMAKIILLPYFSFLNFKKEATEKFIGRLFAWLFLISILVNLLPYITMI